MSSFSDYYCLEKTQWELDFVDIPIDEDIPLFIDPFAISQRPDRFSQECNQTLMTFFDRIIQDIRSGRGDDAKYLLRFLREPNETHLGLSKSKPRGAGIGKFQADELYRALKDSSAVRTGFINCLEDCELLIEGIGRDKISDLTTNVIRWNLVEYTQEQCKLFNIPLVKRPLGPYFSLGTLEWISDYYDLPIVNGNPILLVPKVFSRYDPAYNHQKYYNYFVLSYLQAEHLNAQTSLVRTLKRGRQVVYKKDLKPNYPCTKQFLFDFSRKHPEVLEQYREHLKRLEDSEASSVVETEDEYEIAGALSLALRKIPHGNEHANYYHQLMVGLVEFIFFPDLIFPRKEEKIHQGRKRIDIVMNNAAKSGIFNHLPQLRKVPCAYVVIECKNFGNEIGNPGRKKQADFLESHRYRKGVRFIRSKS